MGIPKSFNFLGCLEVTFILRDFKTLTGKIIRDFDDRKSYDYDKHDDCNKEDDKCDFILVELTRDAESVSLQEIEAESDEIEIEWVNVEFRKGSCIAINVCDIIYAGVNAEIEEQDFEIEFENDLATSDLTTTVPTA